MTFTRALGYAKRPLLVVHAFADARFRWGTLSPTHTFADARFGRDATSLLYSPAAKGVHLDWSYAVNVFSSKLSISNY